MADSPAVTVLIPTRNRAPHLAASLGTVVEAATRSSVATEVFVIDNGSTDDTQDLLARAAQTSPLLRTVVDPVPGKSGVLNRGLLASHGDVIVFTDDDVHVPPTWVDDMAQPILRREADAVCGRVVLAPHLDRPWFTPRLRVPLAELLDVTGPEPGMVGANMAASRAAATAIGFDEQLGPGAKGFADDMLFNLRLKAGGYRLVGSDGPPVVHHFDPDRLTYQSMRSLADRNGASIAYVWHHWMHTDLSLVPVRRLRSQIALAWYRRRQPHGPDAISEQEFEYLEKLSFYRHLVAQRGTAPAYPPRPPSASRS